MSVTFSPPCPAFDKETKDSCNGVLLPVQGKGSLFRHQGGPEVPSYSEEVLVWYWRCSKCRYRVRDLGPE